jgi:hypothetical protein
MPIEGRDTIIKEVNSLRAAQQFSTETSIRDDADVSRRHVDKDAFDVYSSDCQMLQWISGDQDELVRCSI